MYVFDRVTGEPVWPIVEKPVPQSDVPGEKTAATQPFPPDSLLYARNSLKLPDDLIDFTPQLRPRRSSSSNATKCRAILSSRLRSATDKGMLGAIVAGTATNWPGGGYDPELHIAFAPAGNNPGVRALRTPPAEFTDMRYVAGVEGRPFQIVLGPGDCCAADPPLTAERARAGASGAPPPPRAGTPPADLTVGGLPIVKPPYGLLAAVDLDKGQLKWQTPHGDTPDDIRNNPALKGMNIPKTGQPGTWGVGLLVTKTLVIMGDPQSTTTPDHPKGAMLRAYDKQTRPAGRCGLDARRSRAARP